MTQHPPLRLIVLMPLRDDWPSAAELIRRLDKAISSDACTMEVLLVDDGSVQRCDRNDCQGGFSVVRAIRTLRLRRNLGHQRAIAIGLAHVQQTTSDAVVVMDADGEDTPGAWHSSCAPIPTLMAQRQFSRNGAAGRNLLCFDLSIISTNSCIDA